MSDQINAVSRPNQQQANPFTASFDALLKLQGAAYTPSIPSPTSVINLSNSSDVVFGSMINYQGPVTINQYMDNTVEECANQTTKGTNSSPREKIKFFSEKTRTILKLCIRFVVIALVVSGILFYLEFNTRAKQKDKAKRSPILFDSNYTRGTFPNLGNGHLVIDRIQWDTSELAKPLTVPLKHPIPYVLLSHVGRQLKPCQNVHKCSIQMQTLQDGAIAEKNLADIYSNFYIADDGNVYVGRGWYFANTYAIDSLAITFLGDFDRYVPSRKLMEALALLLTYSVSNKHVANDFKIIALNQTKHMEGTGDNIYREVKHWPHFYPCNLNGTVKCFRELEVN